MNHSMGENFKMKEALILVKITNENSHSENGLETSFCFHENNAAASF